MLAVARSNGESAELPKALTFGRSGARRVLKEKVRRIYYDRGSWGAPFQRDAECLERLIGVREVGTRDWAIVSF